MDKYEMQKRLKTFALRVFKMAETLPRNQACQIVSYQLLKATSSGAANYRAACRAKLRDDFIYKLNVVLEEIDESNFWIDFLIDLPYSNKDILKKLLQESDELISIFTKSIKTSKQNKSKTSNLKS